MKRQRQLQSCVRKKLVRQTVNAIGYLKVEKCLINIAKQIVDDVETILKFEPAGTMEAKCLHACIIKRFGVVSSVIFDFMQQILNCKHMLLLTDISI